MLVGHRVVSLRYFRQLRWWSRCVRLLEWVPIPVFPCMFSPYGLSCRKSCILSQVLCICSPRVVVVEIHMIGIPPWVANSRRFSRYLSWRRYDTYRVGGVCCNCRGRYRHIQCSNVVMLYHPCIGKCPRIHRLWSRIRPSPLCVR